MSEFELGEEIELCNTYDFMKGSCFKGKYIHTNPNDIKVWAVDKNGYMISGSYARKIAPRVMIHVNSNVGGKLYYGDYEIPTALLDKIRAGEFE